MRPIATHITPSVVCMSTRAQQPTGVRVHRPSSWPPDLVLDRVRLVLGSLIVFSRYSTHIRVVGSWFTGDPDNPGSQFLGGLHLSFSTIGANVTIADCVFSNQASTALLSTVVKSDQIPQIETTSYAKIRNETVPKIIIHDTIEYFS